MQSLSEHSRLLAKLVVICVFASYADATEGDQVESVLLQVTILRQQAARDLSKAALVRVFEDSVLSPSSVFVQIAETASGAHHDLASYGRHVPLEVGGDETRRKRVGDQALTAVPLCQLIGKDYVAPLALSVEWHAGYRIWVFELDSANRSAAVSNA